MRNPLAVADLLSLPEIGEGRMLRVQSLLFVGKRGLMCSLVVNAQASSASASAPASASASG